MLNVYVLNSLRDQCGIGQLIPGLISQMPAIAYSTTDSERLFNLESKLPGTHLLTETD